ncbi:GNAT family N-acetyltransferase [Cellulosimicrobium marinum]|uniref:GNAT family N-acetyltransferase n=1 Tax=Cellulosimicrobium marinum TaxID=1638992 RepID=UPI001E5AEE89|nr:GNAT family N-acetyltransferase [Cellulosimicrobium marinum]MCB7137796.1 GNAT family N-acetyltransferase [Cellulosimicrobium marinum]
MAERVQDAAGLAAAHALRLAVFVDEQHVPVEEEIDALDTAPTTTHVLVRDAGGAVVGTGRLLTDPAHPGEVHVGRVAVAATARGTGAGAAVMRALEAIALAEHAVPGPDGRPTVHVELSAQVQAVGFYERLGYTVSGPVYLDAGIDHRDATKTLQA